MPIDAGLRDKLATGTEFVAKYKGTEHRCEVVTGEDGKRRFRLADGREFKSPSSAGSAVMGGTACNGWRFWSVAGASPTAKPEKQTAAKAARPKCDACGKSFVAEKQLEHHAANAERLCRPA
ncbi:MAG: hypothetical protein CVU47_00630 [Chloroflexi bacterium HGW-Chloroflexi-9]|nr:MAG: hypothetical protein CVU47_00630 [Chloroflexi bacterium HGW-Chloroflexi-9]